MADLRGPWRYDKPGYHNPGGLQAASTVNSDISGYKVDRLFFNETTADDISIETYLSAPLPYGAPFWIRPGGSGEWIKGIIHSGSRFTNSGIILYLYIPLEQADLNTYPAAGPVTEWFLSYYDPDKTPPWDPSAPVSLLRPVVATPTAPSSEVGCWVPFMQTLPPSVSRYWDTSDVLHFNTVEPMGLGHVVGVVNYNNSGLVELYACTKYEVDDTVAAQYPGKKPLLREWEWTPIDLDFPKYDKATGKPNDEYSLYQSGMDITDLATE